MAWARASPTVSDDGYGAFDGDQGNRGPDFVILAATVDLEVAAVTASKDDDNEEQGEEEEGEEEEGEEDEEDEGEEDEEEE